MSHQEIDALLVQLINTNVLRFGKFILKSRIEAPYFFNAGNLNTGYALNLLCDMLSRRIIVIREKHKANGQELDVVYGPAYKGIPLAAGVCSTLYNNYGVNMPYIYNRKEEKDHGEGGVIVGLDNIPAKAKNVLIIDDVITMGTATKEAVNTISNNTSMKVTDVLVILDRCEIPAGEKICARILLEKDLDVQIHSLLNVHDVIDITEKEEKQTLIAYVAENCS